MTVTSLEVRSDGGHLPTTAAAFWLCLGCAACAVHLPTAAALAAQPALCTPPTCSRCHWAAPQCTAGCDCHEALYEVNASRASHTALTRQIATESIVLLQNDRVNDRDLLPLAPGVTVALLGSACVATNAVNQDDWTAGNYYTVGGSGRVIGPYAVSVREGLEARGVRLVVEERDDVDGVGDAAGSGSFRSNRVRSRRRSSPGHRYA